MASLIRRAARGQGLLPVAVLFTLLLIILILMGRATTHSAQFGQMYTGLLISGAVGLGVLALLILYNLTILIRRYRAHIPGARLTLRLSGIFAVLAIVPVAIVYSFSLHFLQRGIDSWFNIEVDRGLENAIELSRTALDLRMREVLKQTRRIATVIADRAVDEGAGDEQVARRLEEWLDLSEAAELTLFSHNGRMIATVSAEPALTLPESPPDILLLHARQGRDYVVLEPILNTGFHVRVLVPVDIAGNETLLLQALFPVTDRLSVLADAVQSAFGSYKELMFLREPLKASFTLTLSLTLLLAVLAAFWAAFHTARRLVQPLKELAEGTEAVAAGRFDKQLPSAGGDELGFLVQSFNQMMRNLSQARDAARRGQEQVEGQRAYLETVLARLSSGVITIDQAGRLQTCNAAASQVLGVDLSVFIGSDHQRIAAAEPILQDFIAAIGPQIIAANDWREEISWFGGAGRRVLMCRGSVLPDSVGLRGGRVVVFDDITNLVRVERDAAWAEVARRLAHEIKNPLTPIQLAAERIRHKCLRQLDAEHSKILDRGTHTIIQQVQAMKEMVDAFDEYARPPRLKLAPLNLNEFVAEVLYLYRDYPAGVEIKLNLSREALMVSADPGRLRQLLHNLVKNAIEAIQDGHGSTLWVSAHREHTAGADCAELSILDDGPGFSEHILVNAFEPYVTTKPKGTGLGLAVVKKIVEEHGGWVQLEAPEGGGAHVRIRLPLLHSEPRSLAIPTVPSNTEKEPA